ncbi:5273_t:CDS:2 [Gigaspora rosea]|nr:5273_t:CDS:2 [Gigaspora rosea]
MSFISSHLPVKLYFASYMYLGDYDETSWQISDDNGAFSAIVIDTRHQKLLIFSEENNPRYWLVKKFNPHSKDLYFGPFLDGTKAWDILQILEKVFSLAKCKGNLGKPCLDYSLGQCSSRCFKKVEPKYYQIIKKKITDFFQGKIQVVKKELQKSLQKSINNQEFELAKKEKKMLDNLNFLLTGLLLFDLPLQKIKCHKNSNKCGCLLRGNR